MNRNIKFDHLWFPETDIAQNRHAVVEEDMAYTPDALGRLVSMAVRHLVIEPRADPGSLSERAPKTWCSRPTIRRVRFAIRSAPAPLIQMRLRTCGIEELAVHPAGRLPKAFPEYGLEFHAVVDHDPTIPRSASAASATQPNALINAATLAPQVIVALRIVIVDD